MNLQTILSDFFKENKLFLLRYLSLFLTYPIKSIYIPKYASDIIDNIKTEKKLKIKTLIILFIISYIMQTTIDYLDTYFFPKLESYVVTRIIKYLLEYYNNKYTEQEIGILLTYIIKLPHSLVELTKQIKEYIIPLIFNFIFLVIRLYTINPKLGIFSLVLVLLITFTFIQIMINITKQILNNKNIQNNNQITINENISEIFSNILDVLINNNINEEIEKIQNQYRFYNQDILEIDTKYTQYKIIFENTCIVSFIALVVYSYKLSLDKKIKTGDVLSIIFTSMPNINRTTDLASELLNIINNFIVCYKFNNFLTQLIPEKQNTIIKNPEFFKHPNIKFSDVSVHYQNKIVLENINLYIPQKTSLCILGQIGSGKSTLIKSLLRLVDYTGDIFINDINIKTLTVEFLRSHIIYIQQNPIPFNRTIIDNIKYGNNQVTEKQINDLFIRYDLYNIFKPDLYTYTGKKGSNLSGGQRQIIFLLRVLVSNKPIIILDEPTSSLDKDSTNYIIKILQDILKTRTVIIITHDESFVQICDHTIRIGKK